MTGFHQFFRVGLEHAHTLRLYIRSHRTADVRTFVPVQTGNPQGIIDHINGTFYITFLIGVLDPQNKIAVLFLGDQIGKQCGTQVADGDTVADAVDVLALAADRCGNEADAVYDVVVLDLKYVLAVLGSDNDGLVLDLADSMLKVSGNLVICLLYTSPSPRDTR